MKKLLINGALVGLFGLQTCLAQSPTSSGNLQQQVKNSTAALTKMKQIAVAEASYLRKKYGGDENMEKRFATILYNKSVDINQAIEQFGSTSQLDGKLGAIISKHDSIMQLYLRPAAATHYIKQKIAMLDSIKILANDQRQKITNTFLNSTKTSGDDRYADLFKSALQTLGDTSYFAHIYRKWIEKNADERVTKSVAKSKQPKSVSASTRSIFFQYHKALVTVSYTFAPESKQNRTMSAQIERHYKPLLDSALMRDGALIEKSQLSAVLRMAKPLQISVKQKDSILLAGDRLVRDRMLFLDANPDQTYKYQSFERRELAKILKPEQYTRLLQSLYVKEAEFWADSQWKEVEDYKLIDKTDSISLKKQLMSYQLNKLITKERFGDDLPQQAAQLRQIESNKPKIVKLLDAARRSPQKADAIAGKLSW